MAIVEKVSKIVDLDLSDVPVSDRATVKKEVGDFIVEEILRAVSSAKSPVSGGKYKKKLNKKYADSEKGGNRTANLELDGDMLDALKAVNRRGNKIEVGVFKSSEIDKAYGHNTGFEGHPTLAGKNLEREFIPKEGQEFSQRITRGIKQIVSEFKVDKQPTESDDFFRNIFTVEESEERVDLQVGDLFNEDFLTQFLRDEGII